MNPMRILAAATILAAGLAQPAFAGEADVDRRQVFVRYTDLDLTQAADARRLLARISTAARHNCRPANRRHGLGMSSRECRDQAVTAAVRNIDAPMLTAIYSGDRKAVLASK